MLRMHAYCGVFALGIGMVAMAGSVSHVRAQGTPVKDLPTADEPGSLKGLPEFADPPVYEPSGNGPQVGFALKVLMMKWGIWNPVTQRADAISLRGYDSTPYAPVSAYPVGATISVVPGNVLNLALRNQLPSDDPSCEHMDHHDINVPHCFNSTNLHTHGLWIDPGGNSDNVLLDIKPGQVQDYVFHIPTDHPAGTFWYHAHLHGSTALQLSSGMAGALIIRGHRLPTPAANGDVDTLVMPRAFEHILVLQQIQYYCRDSLGKIKTNPDGTYRCDAGDVGGIDSYEEFGPGRWLTSGRYTTINGLVVPWFPGQTGRLERWRVIHAGIRDTVNLRIAKLQEGAPSPARLSVKDQQAYIDQNCTGRAVPQYLFAADGLTMQQIRKTDQTIFQPGYRWDILTYFQEPGEYCLIDDAMPPGSNVARVGHSRKLLGIVWVKGGTIPGDTTDHVRDILIDSARANMPTDVRERVIDDLGNGLLLTKFTPHPDVVDNELTGRQAVVYNIENPTTRPVFKINGRSFNPHETPRLLPLGGVEEWTVKSDFAGHPHHIHVNPFEIVAIYDKDGKDVSAPGAVDGSDPQYPGLKGVWKDTIWIKNPAPGAAPDPRETYTVVYRTRYERYTGLFVLHCHILDHEDQGMMELEEIVPRGK